jgi:hypothetical protein
MFQTTLDVNWIPYSRLQNGNYTRFVYDVTSEMMAMCVNIEVKINTPVTQIRGLQGKLALTNTVLEEQLSSSLASWHILLEYPIAY